MRRVELIGSLVLSLLALSSPVGATPTFPGVLQSELDLTTRPPCSTCHVGGSTRSGDLTPFARSLLSRGLRPGNDASLRRALQALEAEGKDSDGDGAGDIEELVAGTDPNLPEADSGVPAVELGTETPVYGCSLTEVPGGTAPSCLASLGLLVGLALRLRRRTSPSEIPTSPQILR